MIDIEIHNVNCVITGGDKYPQLRTCLETLSPGYQYTYLFKSGRWNGKVNLMAKGQFPTGLLSAVFQTVHEFNIPHVIIDKRVAKQIHIHPSPVQLRPYQEEIVQKCMFNMWSDTWWPRGVIQVATGGGKTEIAADMICKAQVPTIFLVHRQDLETQAIERFVPFGIDAGPLANIGHQLVTVTTIQSLMSWNMEFQKHYENAEGAKLERSDEWLARKGKKQDRQALFIKEKLTEIDQVFIDEAHLVAAKAENMNMFSTALSLMPNAYMRWGLTATPFLRDKLHNWMLEGATGPALAQITNRELIDMGYLSEAFVDIFVMPKEPSLPADWPRCYDYGIVTNKTRNERIVDCYKTYPGPTLIMVSKLGHGVLLQSELKKAGFSLPFLSGTSSQTERLQVLNSLKSGTLSGAIVSTIWDEGIDCPQIKAIIIAGAGKSEIKNLQRLGRGLRLAAGKSEVKLIDFFDSSPAILKKHSEIRKKLWQDQGFIVNLLK
mgnify:CR=1 FL=1